MAKIQNTKNIGAAHAGEGVEQKYALVAGEDTKWCSYLERQFDSSL